MLNFKSEIFSSQDRKSECEQLLKAYPEKIPLIIEPQNSVGNKLFMDQNKFLVPKMYTFHELLFLIRKKLKIHQDEALYVTVKSSYFPVMSRSINSIYNEYKDPDGFLYIYYSSEAIWG